MCEKYAVTKVDTGDDFTVSNALLMEKVANGDRAAEQVFIERFTPMLGRFITTKLNEVELHGDVLQETFIRMLVKLRERRILKPQALQYYLLSIASHLIYQMIRQRNRDLENHSDIDIDSLSVADECGYQMIELTDNHQRLLAAIAKLGTERDRLLMTALLLEHQTKPQVCLQLGLTKKQFDTTLYRAKKRLAQNLC